MMLTKNEILATLICSIVTVELFMTIALFEVVDFKRQSKIFGSNDYLVVKSKQFKNSNYKEGISNFSLKEINKKNSLYQHIYSLSAYLSRGFRYEKNASLEQVGDQILSLLRLPSNTNQIPMSKIKQKTALVIDRPVKDKFHTDLVKNVYTTTPDTLQRSLSKLVKDISIEVVILTHSTFLDLSDSSKIRKLVTPVLSGKADLVGSTIVDKQGKWKLGCYLKKVLWFQYRIYEGYDLKPGNKEDGYLDCDYIAGAFAIRKNILTEFLASRKKLSPNYAHLFSFMTAKNMVIKLCVSCVSSQQTNAETLFPYNRVAFTDFLVTNKLSKFIPPDNNALELGCSQAKFTCWPIKGKGILISKCCIKELDDLLISTLKECDLRRWYYTLVSGTLVGSMKLEQTLPWELDHDVQLEANKLLLLKELSRHFRTKYGYSFVYELNGVFPKCVKNKGYICGWIGIKSTHWRLEVPGRSTLFSDINRYGADVTQATSYPNSRVKTNTTLTLMSGYWTKSVSSPGNYIRLKYGRNCLKHVKHIYSNHLSHDSNYLKRKVFKWETCARPGYHACNSELPADGNLGYRDVWV